MMQLAVDGRHALGECALWCERTGRLWWTDIAAATLWCHAPATGAREHWKMPEPLACFALTEHDDRLLLGLASGLAVFDLSSGDVQPICAVETRTDGARLNDGRCDRQGRFVFGMFHPGPPGEKPAVGAFYRFDSALGLEQLPLPPAAIANSICFSPDGATMYFCDSHEKIIHACDYGDTVGAPRVFADLRHEQGEPDGSIVDSEGFLWNALWGGRRLLRFAPDGRLERSIAIAAPHPTSVAFGGHDLKTLYATSATQGLSEQARQAYPASGGVFHLHGEVAGLPETRFVGGQVGQRPAG